jgi:hypothetical protein
VADAARANLFLVIAVPFVLGYWVDWVGRERTGLPRRLIRRQVIVAVVVLATVFMIVRNLPAFAPR